MGNKITRRRPAVDERFTRPQGLYQHKDVDHKKLRRLILDAKLAPCYPGADDQCTDLDECPICFLFYPSLNRSKCCTKEICTECFLQMKSPHAARLTQCPFCKTPNYAVEYRGAKTLEEKGIERAEEQRVIEAKIRIRQKEMQDEEKRMQRKEEDVQEGSFSMPAEFLRHKFLNLHGFMAPLERSEVDRVLRYCEEESIETGGIDIEPADTDIELDSVLEASRQRVSVASSAHLSTTNMVRNEVMHDFGGGTSVHSQGARVTGSPYMRINRDEEFDLDLENIMVMEAMWLSIQEQGVLHGQSSILLSRVANDDTTVFLTFEDDNGAISTSAGIPRGVPLRNSVTGGLAGAIAALAERQVLGMDNSAARHVGQNHQLDSETRESNPIMIQSNTGSSRELPLASSSQEEGLNAFEYAYATPASSQIQLDRGGDSHREERTSLDHKSEEGEERRYEPTWMEQHESTFDNQDTEQELNSWIELSLESGRALFHTLEENRGSMSEWMLDHSSEAVELGTSFSSSIPSASELPWEAPDVPSPMSSSEDIVDPQGFTTTTMMVPENFEERIMLAMTLSLAEAQGQSRRL